MNSDKEFTDGKMLMDNYFIKENYYIKSKKNNFNNSIPKGNTFYYEQNRKQSISPKKIQVQSYSISRLAKSKLDPSKV